MSETPDTLIARLDELDQWLDNVGTRDLLATFREARAALVQQQAVDGGNDECYRAEAEHLVADLAANAALLARQCDLAREAETQLREAEARQAATDEALARLEQESMSSTKLWSVRDAARDLLSDLDMLIGESRGVCGLHLNGNEVSWDEIIDKGRFERLRLEDLRIALDILALRAGEGRP